MKGMHLRRSSAQDFIGQNQMIEKPIIHNADNIRSMSNQQLSLVNK